MALRTGNLARKTIDPRLYYLLIRDKFWERLLPISLLYSTTRETTTTVRLLVLLARAFTTGWCFNGRTVMGYKQANKKYYGKGASSI